ncbi:MAG TPA: hypothetical protein VHR66_15895 [Gemmataceae bacterium]|nr:hypothetical protein [Gemmataceae bacterium]
MRLRAASRSPLRLELLEDRLPPGQVAPVAAALVAGTGVALTGLLDEFVPKHQAAAAPTIRANTPDVATPTKEHTGILSKQSSSVIGAASPAQSESRTVQSPAAIESSGTPAALDGVGLVDLSPSGTTSAVYFTGVTSNSTQSAAVASNGSSNAKSATTVPSAASSAKQTAPTTGPVAPPPTPIDGSSIVQFAPLTTTNRNSPTMSGGWNPALRSILVMDDGSRWFAAETGGDVSTNTSMVYYKFGLTGWRPVGSVNLPAGIQQNMATITNGKVIYSYGCTRNTVIETYFDTTHPGFNRSTSNAITAGGVAITPGREANYVGAAWHNNTRIVWWTTVGANGTGGTWSHCFNSGRGWNGPVTISLGGYTDVGYVRAQFDEKNRLRMIGEAYSGEFPAGGRYLVSATLVLGNACAWTPIFPQTARSPLDLWREDGSVGTQYLYRVTPTKVGYSFGPKGAPKPVLFNALEARFISDADHLALVLGYQKSVEIRIVPRSQASAWIDWKSIAPIKVSLPKNLQTAGVSAIWNVDSSRQPYEPSQMEFAICGGYPARDNLIYDSVLNSL